MPVQLLVPLHAPLSRTDDAVLIPSPCMACGAEVLHWGWVNLDGVGVLLHDAAQDSVPCPVAAPFDWATGNTLPASHSAVAA
ncbi:hypothetical protein [Streptomyces goshikiensis]|uniref:hypothetical protein n=1 Tax=Streptomyces goshikiensis TaxID=1942 RepID=UPI0036D177C1